MRIQILGRRWELRYARLTNNRGECEDPTKTGKQIRISTDLPPQEELEVLIHEMLHAAGWHLDEQYVEQFADEVSAVLWRLGYRRVQSEVVD